MKKIILTLLITFSLPAYGMENISQERINFMCSVGTYEPYECIKIEPQILATSTIEMEGSETVSTTTVDEEIQRKQMLIMIEQLQLLIKLLKQNK